DLSGLTRVSDVYATGGGNVDNRWSTLTATHGGTIVAPRLTDLAGVALTLDGTGTLSTSQISTFSNGGIFLTNTAADLSGLSAIIGAQITVNGLHEDLHNLTVLRGSSLTLSGGGTAD